MEQKVDTTVNNKDKKRHQNISISSITTLQINQDKE